MRLFILRHGEAESYASSDAQRNLTELGRQQTQAVLNTSFSDLKQVTKIIASPYVRAQQTAQLAAELLGLSVETVATITPDNGYLEALLALEHYTSETLLMVSHQPLVGALVDRLSGCDRGLHFMGTSHLACLDVEVLADSCAELQWLKKP